MKKIDIIMFGAVFALMLIFVGTFNTVYADEAFAVTSYDVDVTVSEDKVLTIVETIEVYFNEEKHGIIRDIPINKESTLYDVEVNGNYTVATTEYEDYTYVEIQMGDLVTTVLGEHTYVLEYKIDLNDGIYNGVEFYLIGSEWDTTIDNATFSFTMPEDAIIDDVLCLTTLENQVDYEINSNVITGSYDGTLESEGIYIQVVLNSDYFADGINEDISQDIVQETQIEETAEDEDTISSTNILLYVLVALAVVVAAVIVVLVIVIIVRKSANETKL